MHTKFLFAPANVYIILLVKQTKWLPLMVSIAALTNAGINIALIPKIGIMGAAISTIASYFILMAIVTVWARRVITYRVDFKFLSKVILAAMIMGGCLRFIPTDSVLGIIAGVIAGIAIFALGLFLFKAISREDRQLLRDAFTGLDPRLWVNRAKNKHGNSSGKQF